MMFQWRDEEDPESRARRLAHDRDHHAQVIKTGSEFFCLSFVRKDTRALVRVVYVGKFCRLQARDQEEEGQRIARLAGQMARQARV